MREHYRGPVHAGIFEIWLNTICPIKGGCSRTNTPEGVVWHWIPKDTATIQEIEDGKAAVAALDDSEASNKLVISIYNSEMDAGRDRVE